MRVDMRFCHRGGLSRGMRELSASAASSATPGCPPLLYTPTPQALHAMLRELCLPPVA